MAAHLTSAQIQTILAKTTSALKPYELQGIIDALGRVKASSYTDADKGVHESTLATIFPNGGLNP